MKNLFLRMMKEKDRPKIKIRLNSVDWLIEIAAIIFLLLLIGFPVYFYGELPNKIPVHFNAAGTADGYGSKASLWMLPLTGLFIYVIMTVLAPFPYIFNYVVKITQENATVQYTLAVRLLRILKTVILIMFTIISYQTIQTATGKSGGLGRVFLPVFLIATFGVVIIYFVQSLNNSTHS